MAPSALAATSNSPLVSQIASASGTSPIHEPNGSAVRDDMQGAASGSRRGSTSSVDSLASAVLHHNFRNSEAHVFDALMQPAHDRLRDVAQETNPVQHLQQRAATGGANEREFLKELKIGETMLDALSARVDKMASDSTLPQDEADQLKSALQDARELMRGPLTTRNIILGASLQKKWGNSQPMRHIWDSAHDKPLQKMRAVAQTFADKVATVATAMKEAQKVPANQDWTKYVYDVVFREVTLPGIAELKGCDLRDATKYVDAQALKDYRASCGSIDAGNVHDAFARLTNETSQAMRVYKEPEVEPRPGTPPSVVRGAPPAGGVGGHERGTPTAANIGGQPGLANGGAGMQIHFCGNTINLNINGEVSAESAEALERAINLIPEKLASALQRVSSGQPGQYVSDQSCCNATADHARMNLNLNIPGLGTQSTVSPNAGTGGSGAAAGGAGIIGPKERQQSLKRPAPSIPESVPTVPQRPPRSKDIASRTVDARTDTHELEEHTEPHPERFNSGEPPIATSSPNPNRRLNSPPEIQIEECEQEDDPVTASAQMPQPTPRAREAGSNTRQRSSSDPEVSALLHRPRYIKVGTQLIDTQRRVAQRDPVAGVDIRRELPHIRSQEQPKVAHDPGGFSNASLNTSADLALNNRGDGAAAPLAAAAPAPAVAPFTAPTPAAVPTPVTPEIPAVVPRFTLGSWSRKVQTPRLDTSTKQRATQYQAMLERSLQTSPSASSPRTWTRAERPSRSVNDLKAQFDNQSAGQPRAAPLHSAPSNGRTEDQDSVRASNGLHKLAQPQLKSDPGRTAGAAESALNSDRRVVLSNEGLRLNLSQSNYLTAKG